MGSRMLFAECPGEMIGGLADNLNILYGCIKQHCIIVQLLDGLAIGVLKYIIDGSQNVFQADAVFKRFSHK